MRITPAILAANRRNARKSTGPRTPEGKARSSLNAVTHGLFASTPVLFVSGHSEQEADRNRLVSALSKELFAESALEHYLVERIVNLAWQLLRVERVATHPIKCRHKAFDRCLLEYTRRLIKRTERMYFLFRRVKRTQTSEVINEIEEALSTFKGPCKSNPRLERVI